MEDHGLIARDVALLKKAQGIAANKSFILYFVIAAIMVTVTLIGVFAGGIAGVALLGGIAAVGAVAKFTTFGENLIVAVVVVIGFIVGVIAIIASVGSVFG